MADKKTQVDWEAVERDYRAGLLSVREISVRHGCSHTAVGKRAKAESWSRDLNAKIKAKAEALVAKREVSKEVASKAVETERQIVDANAEAIVSVRMAHRSDIRRSRALASKMLDELEAMTDNRELFAQLSEILECEDGEEGGDAYDKMQRAFRGAMSLPGRVKMSKELSETLRVLIALERQAYNLDEQEHEEPYEARLKRLLGEG